MKSRSVWFVVAALVLIVALQVAPADARRLFPEGSALLVFDINSFLNECITLRPCTLPKCPADALFASFAPGYTRGTYTNVEEEDANGVTHTTIEFRNVFYGLFLPNTKKVILHCTCSRFGLAFFGGPGSCSCESIYKRVLQNTLNISLNEGTSTAAIPLRFCAAPSTGPVPDIPSLKPIIPKGR